MITAYRPDPVVDPEFEGFRSNIDLLTDLTGEDCTTWSGYLAAHCQRRAFFAALGATSTDHGHPTALTANLSRGESERLFQAVISDTLSEYDAELFAAQPLFLGTPPRRPTDIQATSLGSSCRVVIARELKIGRLRARFVSRERVALD